MRTKRLEVTTYIITALLIVWLAVSFIEVISHNLEAGYVYSPLNAFQVFMNVFKEVRG